ncbi:hypothetical protein GCM10010492_58290 [Saccharothrix mutabilis subsp. mutabilis]|uniref:Gram-positive cocci surface proteins LPxTG domain-containing protein n=2 Tax=Saccharothrix mutabilis TaxID=33921 RepID=A0ABN0UH99_9PSEU
MVTIVRMRTRRFAGLTGGLALIALVAAHGIGVANATDRPEPPGVITAWADPVDEVKGEPPKPTTTTGSTSSTTTTTTDNTTTTTTPTDNTTTTTDTTTTTGTTGTTSDTTTTTPATTTTSSENTTTSTESTRRFPPLGFSREREHPPGGPHRTAALANTGFTPGTLLLVGGLLLIAGTALLTLSARRRT